MNLELAGKAAIVTGASRGIGKGCALELGAAGATVYCTGRSTRAERSEMDRPETIEETAELDCDAAPRTAIAGWLSEGIRWPEHISPGSPRS